MDPVLTGVLIVVLVFFGVLGAFFLVTFIATWRRGPTTAQRPAPSPFNLLPRPVLLVVTGAGAIACVVFALFWIVLFSGFR